MCKTVFVLLMLFSLNAFAYGEFCDGFEHGYKQGACYGKSMCMAPMTPMCPMARMGEDSYQGGYNRGFLQGLHNQR